MDANFLDMTMDPAAMQAFAAAEPTGTPLVVQHNHGYITAQKVDKPRDEALILNKLKIISSMAGDNYYYEWNTNNRDGTQGTVTGGTIKLANDLARIYGNCVNAIDCREINSHWLFKARFTDLETGYSLERLFRQRFKQDVGKKMDADRQTDIIFQIGQSKAIRNVTLNALQTFADFAVEEARASLIEKIGKNVDHFRVRATEALEEMGIPLVNVERILARKVGEWRAKDLAKIRANINSIRDGMATKEDLFPAHSGAAPSMESENLAQTANAAAAGAPDPKAKDPEPEQQKPVEEKKPEPQSQAEPEKPKEPEAAKPKRAPAKKKDDPTPAPEMKFEPPKETAPPPAKQEDAAPLVNDDGLAEGKDLYDQLVIGFNAAITKCEEAGSDEALAEFNDAIIDTRKLLLEPWKGKFRDLMREAWKRDFKK